MAQVDFPIIPKNHEERNVASRNMGTIRNMQWYNICITTVIDIILPLLDPMGLLLLDGGFYKKDLITYLNELKINQLIFSAKNTKVKEEVSSKTRQRRKSSWMNFQCMKIAWWSGIVSLLHSWNIYSSIGLRTIVTWAFPQMHVTSIHIMSLQHTGSCGASRLFSGHMINTV